MARLVREARRKRVNSGVQRLTGKVRETTKSFFEEIVGGQAPRTADSSLDPPRVEGDVGLVKRRSGDPEVGRLSSERFLRDGGPESKS